MIFQQLKNSGGRNEKGKTVTKRASSIFYSKIPPLNPPIYMPGEISLALVSEMVHTNAFWDLYISFHIAEPQAPLHPQDSSISLTGNLHNPLQMNSSPQISEENKLYVGR